MLTTESAIKDVPTLLRFAIARTKETSELAVTDVITGVVSAVTCVRDTSESSTSFLGDSISSTIMGVFPDLITFPDQS